MKKEGNKKRMNINKATVKAAFDLFMIIAMGWLSLFGAFSLFRAFDPNSFTLNQAFVYSSVGTGFAVVLGILEAYMKYRSIN